MHQRPERLPDGVDLEEPAAAGCPAVRAEPEVEGVSRRVPGVPVRGARRSRRPGICRMRGGASGILAKGAMTWTVDSGGAGS
ncbi:hypothetical protein BJ969_001481 [Saccharopolyspora gloriosae]|uniref:Uncharacterized protein n=1 Tax=Saccharopolyspora gloriosae TaxID=455344 RepID=A0A840NDK6_9PSEU|nr:hypothetical protein [Saccharopolyspora gloriosae]